jgi:hypothetical protein
MIASSAAVVVQMRVYLHILCRYVVDVMMGVFQNELQTLSM